ncbi:MAG: MMPL family transporter [Phycisphaeraceae bacterium]|nr:MMPL family transporter [Phycisphaeraceae bacterium]
MHDKARHRWLAAWAGMVSRHPWPILTAAALLAVASVVISVLWLHFEPDRNALISQELDFNRRYLTWINTFRGESDMYVVVDTHSATGEPDEHIAEQAQQLVHELGQALADDPDVEWATWGFSQSQISPKAMRLEPAEQFDAHLREIEQGAQLLLGSDSPAAFFAGMMEQMQQRMFVAGDQITADPQEIGFFVGLLRAIDKRLTTPADQPVDLMAATMMSEQGDGGSYRAPWQYLATPNDRLLLIRVTPKLDQQAMNPFSKPIERVRQLIDEYRAKYPDVPFGLTGIDVIDTDETAAVQHDSTVASIVAAVLIAVLLVLAFHSFRLPLVMMTALGIGIAWTFGFTTLAIGHLQVISITFTMILLGLGVAFAIHLASRFERVRHDYPDDVEGMAAALRDTFAATGPGVLTGAVTTAAAFATTLFTDFRGVAEMGLIAAVGVLLCLIAMFSAFAALLRLLKTRHHQTVRMEDRFVHFYEDRWVMPFARHPIWTLIATALVFAASLWAIAQMRFDYNLLALLPRDLPSVQWQQHIAREGKQEIYTAVSIVNSLDEAASRADRFRRLESVESVGGITAIIPPDDEARRKRINALRNAIERTKPTLSLQQPMPLLVQLTNAQFSFPAFLANLPDDETRQAWQPIQDALNQLVQTNRDLTDGQRQVQLLALQRDFENWQRDTRGYLLTVLDTSPITVEDLSPAALRSYYTDTPDGRKYLLEINPKVPADITDPLDPRFLGHFVEQIESVDPDVTGVIVQVYHSGDLIRRSYTQAGVMALVIVFVLVWIDFRKLIDAAATLAPVAVGFAATFGVMYLAGLAGFENMTINPANIIVLPLMFGIGVDFGVHIIHRYRQDRDTRPLGLSGGTGKGVSLTAYTTMIGFAAMMFAHHRGLYSLGFVLTVGIGMTMLSCWTLMPAFLELRRRRNKDTASEPPAW